MFICSLKTKHKILNARRSCVTAWRQMSSGTSTPVLAAGGTFECHRNGEQTTTSFLLRTKVKFCLGHLVTLSWPVILDHRLQPLVSLFFTKCPSSCEGGEGESSSGRHHARRSSWQTEHRAGKGLWHGKHTIFGVIYFEGLGQKKFP